MFQATVYFSKGVFKDLPTTKKVETEPEALKAYEADKSVSLTGVKSPVIRKL